MVQTGRFEGGEREVGEPCQGQGFLAGWDGLDAVYALSYESHFVDTPSGPAYLPRGGVSLHRFAIDGRSKTSIHLPQLSPKRLRIEGKGPG